MRADRLVATVLILQARGRVSAAQLAAELEVSVKTARRDLEALAVAGVPVYAQPGRNGGWSLLGGARTDLSGLTADEARTLFLLAGPSARLAPEAKTALRKLVRALPEPFRAEAAAAASAVVIDPARWGRSTPAPPPAVDILQTAVIDGVRVRLTYADRMGRGSDRVVDPLGIVQKGHLWYLVAGTPTGTRVFRVDRVRDVERTAEAVVRPDGFDLDAAWQEARTRTEIRRRREAATVHAPSGRLPGLRDQFGDDLTVVRPLDGDRLELEIRASTVESLANELAGWGADLDVVAPAAVRERLATLGAELVRRYAPAGSSSNDG
jgi:predicted DNA-binding transcriptional regulator YafY